MSTRKIREALRGIYDRGTADEVQRAQRAMAEVVAIEKAAQALHACHAAPYAGNSERGKLYYPAMEVIHSIAKDSTS